MSLVTRCPACATTFRVLPAQLAARGGRVRCGQCSVVFDGVSNMLDDDDIAALPVAPSPQASLLESRTETEPGTPVEGPPAPPMIDAAEPAPESSPETAPAFLAPVQSQPARRAAWAIFATLAACGLALQAALAFRSEVAVLLPAARPQIEAACGVLGCDVRLPRRADLMSIESSDLQADTQRQGVIVLNALLRNRAPFAQEYPDLELTLTDQGDQPLVRRVLRPDDYLQDKRAAIGLGGGSEESVRVRIEAGGLLATGYQLFLFYPCPRPSGNWAILRAARPRPLATN